GGEGSEGTDSLLSVPSPRDVVELAMDLRSTAETPPPPLVVINKYPPGQVARVLVLLFAFVLGAYVLWRIQAVLFLLFVAFLFATAIEPIVNRLRRGPFTRGSGVLIVYTAIMLVIGTAGYLVIPSVVG